MSARRGSRAVRPRVTGRNWWMWN